MTTWIKSAITGMMLERPAQKLSVAQHAARLEANGEHLRKHFAGVKGTDKNAEQLRHLIGIERWAQNRLMAVLNGEPVTEDEYDGYRPGEDAGWEALRMEFDETRQATVVLVQELADAEADPTQTIPHNQYGKLSLVAWLRYIDTHSSMEGQRVK